MLPEQVQLSRKEANMYEIRADGRPFFVGRLEAALRWLLQAGYTPDALEGLTVWRQDTSHDN